MGALACSQRAKSWLIRCWLTPAISAALKPPPTVRPSAHIAGHDGRMAPLSFPFRLDPISGAAVTTAEGSAQQINEAIAITVLTHPGERHLNPGFGMPTLPFSEPLEAGPLQLSLTDNGMGHVRITEVTTTPVGDGAAESTITWEVA